jgi:prepilin-type N-terminal cleavage/methylation domain-containing protein
VNRPEPSPPPAHSARLSPGFSLIEILMAVLILALGLLGLGAVVPAVVDQQRRGGDAIYGVAAANSAAAYLATRSDLNRLYEDHTLAPGTEMGWGVWMENTAWGTDYEWYTKNAIGATDTFTGDWSIGSGSREVRTMLNERLWPPASAIGAAPQFVWDFAARRVYSGGTVADPLGMRQCQLVIFVRRIDLGIRVPRGFTLRDVLTGTNGVSSAQRRAPVAVNAAGQPTQTGEDGKGTANYSLPVAMNVAFTSSRRDRLELTGLDNPPASYVFDDLKPFAMRTGQKLVDNLGNVYTVRGVDRTRKDTVLIDPMIPEWVPGSGAPAGRALSQVVFTPQVPAAVRVVTITPPPTPREP